MNNKIKVAAYARVSNDNDMQYNSYGNQLEIFKDYIKEKENEELKKRLDSLEEKLKGLK